MPRITINETDISWFYQQRDPNLLRVFTPGMASFGPDVPMVCNDIDTFYKYFGTKPSEFDTGKSWLKAASYIYAGIPVTFQRIVPDEGAIKANSSAVTITVKSTAGTPSGTFPVTVSQSSSVSKEYSFADNNVTSVEPDDLSGILASLEDQDIITGFTVGTYFGNHVSGQDYRTFTVKYGEDESDTATLHISESGAVVTDLGDQFTEWTALETALGGLSSILKFTPHEGTTISITLLDRPSISINYGGIVQTLVIDRNASDISTSYETKSNVFDFTKTTGASFEDIESALTTALALLKVTDGCETIDIEPIYKFDYSNQTTSGMVLPTSGIGDGTYIYFEAKYAGVYGNNLAVSITPNADNNKIVYVKVWYKRVANNTETYEALETLTYNLEDPTSANWYELVNNTSNYVNLVFDGTGSPNDYTWDWSTLADRKDGNLFGGTDGADGETTVYEQICEKIGNYKNDSTPSVLSDGITGLFEDISDFLNYDVDIIVDGGFNNHVDTTSLSTVDTALFTVAKNRGNTIYLVDGDSEWNHTEVFNYCSLFGSAYAASVNPWGYGTLIYNGVTTLIPGSYVLLINWANSINEGNPKWLSPAGIKRSSINSFYKYPKYVVNKVILDEWQEKSYTEGTKGYKINPIMLIRGNYCIYGNSTLLKDKADGSTSMLQSFNVRVMVDMIRTRAIEITARMQFDQLSDDLFDEFKTVMGAYLDQLKYQQALFDYSITTRNGETLTLADRNTKTLPIKIAISPNAALENIDITLEINQSGISFED